MTQELIQLNQLIKMASERKESLDAIRLFINQNYQVTSSYRDKVQAGPLQEQCSQEIGKPLDAKLRQDIEAVMAELGSVKSVARGLIYYRNLIARDL